MEKNSENMNVSKESEESVLSEREQQLKAISTQRRGGLDSKRRGTKIKLIKSLHVEEQPRKIAKADQVYQDLQTEYSYSLTIVKENEGFRMYTQQAMDTFDDPELELSTPNLSTD